MRSPSGSGRPGCVESLRLPKLSSCLLRDLSRCLFAVNSSRNAHVVCRMLKEKNIDDLRIGPDGLESDFNDITDQLDLAGFRKAGGDMTLNIGHSYLRFPLSTERSVLCRCRYLRRTQANVARAPRSLCLVLP